MNSFDEVTSTVSSMVSASFTLDDFVQWNSFVDVEPVDDPWDEPNKNILNSTVGQMNLLDFFSATSIQGRKLFEEIR